MQKIENLLIEASNYYLSEADEATETPEATEATQEEPIEDVGTAEATEPTEAPAEATEATEEAPVEEAEQAEVALTTDEVVKSINDFKGILVDTEKKIRAIKMEKLPLNTQKTAIQDIETIYDTLEQLKVEMKKFTDSKWE